MEATSRRLPEPLQTNSQIPMHTRDLRSFREDLFFGRLGGYRLRARLSPEHEDMLIFLRKTHHCDSNENEESESESSGEQELD